MLLAQSYLSWCPGSHASRMRRLTFPAGAAFLQRRAVHYVVTTVTSEDFDCIAVRRGDEVVICVADALLSARGAAAMTQALSALPDSDLEESA